MASTPPNSSVRAIPAPSHSRARSASVYSVSSVPALSDSPSTSPHSPTLPQLSPKSLTSFFAGPQSPLKAGIFANAAAGIVMEEDDDHDHDDFHGEFPLSPPRSHTRHASISWGNAPRIGAGSEIDNRIDRGNGLLRRLSLGSAFASRPNPSMSNPSPPQKAAPPAPRIPTGPREAPVARRASNSPGLGIFIPPAQDPIKHRGVSPMGERILKGHFDGFI